MHSVLLICFNEKNIFQTMQVDFCLKMRPLWMNLAIVFATISLDIQHLKQHIYDVLLKLSTPKANIFFKIILMSSMWVIAKNRHSFITREKRHVDIFLKPQQRKQSIRTRLNSIYNKNNPKRIADTFFAYIHKILTKI